MTQLSLTQLLLFSALIGLIIGSFISMLSWRLPRILMMEESEQLKTISLGGSKCPNCDARLPWYRLIPLFSWVFSKGRCHACKARISMRYPLIELTTAGATTLIVWQFGLTATGLTALAFIWILITISVIDIEHQLILDSLSLPLLWLGLLFNTQTLFTTPTDAIWGAAVGYMILWILFHSFKLLTGKEGMGYGDFKLLAALGAWFGLAAIPQIILIASVSSLLIGVGGVLLKLRDYQSPLAFGPFLALGGAVTLLMGSNIM
ncbi:MAG: A24 family peptidase [Thiomicrorhabdus chilensis]|uniref:prepilin peptidase n=1 Tax=Thiomicrorhabdus chilensis TaxID=63656 RepID=UPI00299D5E8C|nr:A24 family peptidase [Thiomicrorhabdus chilensis]MDX1347064.1 A24 family peptidase [Thiomicrorhabdus chilensis]